MRYDDGQVAKLGDKVLLWEGNEGVVVCSFDADEYSEEYPKEEWGYLKTGILIKSNISGLVHYLAPESGMRLVKRESD
jgi:hypothetical protein